MKRPEYNLREWSLEQLELALKKRAKKGGSETLGDPGKEVNYWIHRITDETTLRWLAKLCAATLPRTPMRRASDHTSFLRFIYGCSEKNGTLYSKEQRKRWIAEGKRWDTEFEFFWCLIDCLEAESNEYGLCLCIEMTAHRLADTAIITQCRDYLEESIKLYQRSYEISRKLDINKNACSSYYWALRYLFLFDKTDSRCIDFGKQFFLSVAEYCDTKFIKKKIIFADEIMQQLVDKKSWNEFKKLVIKKCTHKKVKGLLIGLL